MANIQIPGLPSSTAGADTDLYHTRQGATDKSFTGELARQYFGGIIPWTASFNFIIGQSTVRSDKVYEAKTAHVNKDPDLDDGTDWLLKYTNFVDMKSGRKNLVINGNADLWQRGLSGFTGGGYNADRFTQSAARIVDVLRASDAPTGFTYSLLQTGGSDLREIYTSVEMLATGGADIFAVGRTYTLSYWAKSDEVQDIRTQIRFVDVVASPTNAVDVTTRTADGTLSASWQRFKKTFTIAASPNGTNKALQIVFDQLVSTTSNLWITGVQLEEGSVATDFEFRQTAEELALAQRYYELTNTSFFQITPQSAGDIDGVVVPVDFKATKRTTPTVVYIGGSGGVTIANIGVDGCSVSRIAASVNAVFVGVTADAEL